MNENVRRIKGRPMKRGDALRILREMLEYRLGVVAKGGLPVNKMAFVTGETRALERSIDSLLQDRREDLYEVEPEM